jgi:glucosamine-phosphate N-acetyltransferase
MIRKLRIHDYDSFYPLINDFRSTEFTKEKFIEIFNEIHKSSEIWVIEEDSKLIATATIQYEYKYIFNTCILAHIEDVCIKKEYRNKGLGKEIVRFLVKKAQEKGSYKITLDCSKDNVGFYEKCGFEKRGQQMTILIKEPI